MSGKIGSKLRGRPIMCDTIRNKKTSRCILRRNAALKRNSKNKKSTKKKKSRKPTKKTKSKKPTKKTKSKKPTKKKKSKRVKSLMCIPAKFDELVKDCQCHKKWGKRIRMGSGMNGSTYLACKLNNSKDCEYVVKVQRYNQQAKAELDAYLSLKGKKLTPKLHAAWLCAGKMYLVLDKVFHCRFSKNKVKALLDKLYKLGWLQVDVHPGNVMCNQDGQEVLIDFGWAVHKDDQPYRNHPTGLKTFEALQNVQLINFAHL